MAYRHHDQYQASNPENGHGASPTISPYHLTNMANMGSSSMSHASPRPAPFVPSFCRGQNESPQIRATPHEGFQLHEVGLLQPGQEHQLSQDPIATPQSIMDGSYAQAMQNLHENRDIVIIVPRLDMHVGKPSVPTMVFSVNGKPGPYLNDIIKRRVQLDGAFDNVFYEMGWKRTNFTVDWPGITLTTENIRCVEGTHWCTRAEVAHIVASSIAHLIKSGARQQLKWGPQALDRSTRRWDLTRIDYRDVRLMGINYYRRTWVPVLALDHDFDRA